MTVTYGPVVGGIVATSVMVLPPVDLNYVWFIAIFVGVTAAWYLSPLPNTNDPRL